MRTIETTVFHYSELSESAQEKAREWYRHATDFDDFYAECVIDDAATIADLMGIDLNQNPVKLMNGQTRYDPAIYYSGFWSQGDGASFECSYRYKPGSVKAVASHTGNDKELIAIATALQTIQKKYFYSLRAKSKVSGHYVHSNCMQVTVDYYDPSSKYSYNVERETDKGESEITEALRDFANWIYRQLEREYDYQNSDDAIAESIICNEYEFTEEGEYA
jgi:hypothetical protein